MRKNFSKPFLSTLIFLIFIPCNILAAEEINRDPTGEIANYVVDTNPARTTSMIKSGTFTGKVIGASSASSHPAYALTLDYVLNVSIFGPQTGQEHFDTPTEYFEEDFLEKLRESKSFVSEEFKIRHEGFASVRTLQGITYENCDILFFYDIKGYMKDAFAHIFHRLVAANESFNPDELEKLKIRAHVYPDILVLGGVKLDITGKYSNQNVKIGADLKI